MPQNYFINDIIDINVEDYMGLTVLQHAVRNGHFNIANNLLKWKGAIDIKNRGMTSLYHEYTAAQNGHLDIVDLFPSNDADFIGENDTGRIPLHAAAANGSLEIVEKLINHGSNVNKMADNGWTPLYAAVYGGRLGVVRFLISHGATKTRFEGMTVLYIAAQRGDIGLIEYFATTGCDINEGKTCDKTPLLADCYNGDMNFVEMMVTQGAYINQADRNEWTPVHAASQDGHLLVVTYLVENGAKVNATDINGMTPLQAAGDARHEDVKQFLIRWRAKVQDERHKGTEESFRSDRDCPEVFGSSWMHEVSTCDRLSGINGKSWYPMPSKVDRFTSPQNPWRTNRDSLFRPTRESCVSKPKTQLHGGEVPATDDLPINMENSAGDPKPGIKNHRRTNPDIKTTICPTLVSCVSKPKTQLNGGEVPATNNLTITNENDAVDPKLGIKSKRRNIENGLSILTLLLRAIAALAFFFACRPILVAGNLTQPEPVTLEAGTRGVVTFHLQRPFSTLQFSLFYTIQFGSKGRAFCINGKYDVDGFKNPSQVSRFTTTVINRDTFPCVNMTIDDVHTIDGDQYIFIGVWRSSDIDLYDTQKKEVVVQRPPGRADCFITLSDSEFLYEVHCWANTGSMPTTLTCYQNDRDLVKVHNITDNGHTIRAIFFLPDMTHFSCCSHAITSTVAAATCNDFEWPSLSGYSGIPSTEKTTSRGRSASDESNMPTYSRPRTDTVGSGACRPSMIPSHWRFLYLLIYLLVFVINII